MPFTVEEFRDLIRILEERPEWRSELRRLVLTAELLSLPGQIAELRVRSEQQFQALIESYQRLDTRLTALAEAQQRTELRLTALAEAQQRTEARLEALIDQVSALVAAQQRTDIQVAALASALQRTEAQVAALTRAIGTLVDDVGELKGKNLEADYRAKGPAYFSRIVRRPHVLTADELTTLVEDTVERGMLSEADAQELYDADVIVRGKHRVDGTDLYLVVEVSWGVGPYDVERAARRAALFASTGVAAIPVVAGKRITAKAARLAHRTQVWQLTNGQALPPASPPASA